MAEFSVTIAVPTYNRPEKLRRALTSIEKQTVCATEIIVSDNATEGDAVDKVVSDFSATIPNLIYIKQEKNIGAVANFFDCLNRSKSDLFMWVADDDEISDECLQELLQMFKDTPGLATAVPRWHLSTGSHSNFEVMPARSYQSSYWPLRVSKFMYKSTDEIFYGLHRRELLTKCTMGSYFWPNKKETLNVVYPYLLEMVIAGKVIVCNNDKAYWRNHDYGVKHHGQEALPVSFSERLFGHFKYLIRRINLQVLYLSKVKNMRGYLLILPLSLVSVGSILGDFTSYISVLILRSIRSRA